MKNLLYLFAFGTLLCLTACQKDTPTEDVEEESTPKTISAYLPAEKFLLNDLSKFDAAETSWEVVGNVYATSIEGNNFEVEKGMGVLLGKGDQKTLFSKDVHADLELELDFLLLKDAELDLFFQNEYPLKLKDSWNKGESGENGSIENQLASQNVSRSPGLWQQLKTRFRAARYDAVGTKIANARLDYVYINDVLVQDSVEFTTNNNVETNPFRFQLNQGQIAIKNINWKPLAQDSVYLENITYQLYKDLKVDYVPDFSQIQADETGKVEQLTKLEDLAKSKDNFGLVFEGDLMIPHDGIYLFETNIDDGGDLYIDNNLVIHNQGEPGMGTERATVELTAGKHQLKASFYEEVWFAWMDIQVEGPKTEKQYLASIPLHYPWQSKRKSLELEVETAPIIQRAFVNYKEEKRTHTISVGNPAGVHYSYDLREGSLLKSWKAKFADVADMWIGRGESQLLVPLNAVIEFTAGVSVARLNSASSNWPKEADKQFRARGYSIDESGLPIFQYELGDVTFEDHLHVEEGKLLRQINFKGTAKSNLWHRVARADQIKVMSDGWYSIGGAYYLKIKSKQEINIRDAQEQQELMINVLKAADEEVVEYELLW